MLVACSFMSKSFTIAIPDNSSMKGASTVIEWNGYTLLSLKQVLSVLEHKTIILLLLVKYIVYINQSSFTSINVHTVTQITVHINQQT